MCVNTISVGLNDFDVSLYGTHQIEESLSTSCYHCQVPKILQQLPLLLKQSFCPFELIARASFARPAFASSPSAESQKFGFMAHLLYQRNNPHFSTRVPEHLVSDKASHILKHLQNSEHWHALCSVDCFHILDHASTGFQLRIKEAFHIQRKQPSLNQQLHHGKLKLFF